MKKLFFLYVWLNLTRIAELRKEDLVKHIRNEFGTGCSSAMRIKFSQIYKKITTSLRIDYFRV